MRCALAIESCDHVLIPRKKSLKFIHYFLIVCRRDKKASHNKRWTHKKINKPKLFPSSTPTSASNHPKPNRKNCIHQIKKHFTHSLQTQFDTFFVPFSLFFCLLSLHIFVQHFFFWLMPTDVNWYVVWMSYLTIDIKFNTFTMPSTLFGWG